MTDQKITVWYKTTELGIIPKDWCISQLESLINFSNGKAHENDISERWDYIVVNSKFISTEWKVKKYTKTPFCKTNKNDIQNI